MSNIRNDGLHYSPLGNHTPHDSTAITNGSRVRAIQAVDAAGATVIVGKNGVEVTMYCDQGAIYPVGALSLIKDTGTTATNFALFE